MPRLSRRAVLAAAGSLTTAGRLAGPGTGTTTEGSTPTRTPTDPSSPTDETPNGNRITRAANEPDPDHSVYLFNEGTRERTIRVQVVRQSTGDTVFDETRTLAPDTEREVYDLKQAAPDGIEAFTICGRPVDTTPGEPASSEVTTTRGTPDSPYRDCITMRTNACYGTAHVTVREDGELQVIYSIC